MKQLKIEVIDTSIQARYRLDEAVVKEYEEAMRGGAIFPPIEVFAERGSKRFILVDGHHTIAAAERMGRKMIACNVHPGDKEKAFEFALSANSTHGLRRSNADKRKCVLLAMNSGLYEKASMRALAKVCAVSKNLISDIKQEIIEKAKEDPDSPASSAKTKDRVRKTKVPLTQEEVDLEALREAFAIIKSFPYDGAGAAEKFALTDDDVDDLTYSIDWLQELMGK